MGSPSLEYQSRLMALTEKMYFTPVLLGVHRKAKRRHDLELARRSKEDSDLRVRLSAWIKSLPLAARLQVICDKNPWLSAVLRQMFVRKVKEGDGLFTLTTDPDRPMESISLDDNFKFKRVNSESGLAIRSSSSLSAERQLEQLLRLTDSSEYLDTVTFAPELLSDMDKFFRAMADISNNRAFTSPCRVGWDSAAKVWLWETPGWNSGVDQPLVVWAAGCIERHMWMRFWEATHSDPRIPGECQAYSWDLPVLEGFLSSRSTLIDHWKELTPGQKGIHIGTQAQLQTTFTQQKDRWMQDTSLQLGYPQPSFNSLASTSYSPSFMGFFGSPAGTYYTACRARMQCFQNAKSIELLLKATSERPCDFIDFLFLSSLERAGSIIDSVVRTTGSRINTSYQQRLADDLIAAETVVKTKRGGRRKEPRKKASRKNSDVSTAGTAQGHVTEDEEDVYTFIHSTIESLIQGLQLPTLIQDNEEGFQVVSNRRRPKVSKPAPASTSSPKKHKSKGKKGKKTASTTASPQKPVTSKAVFWEEQSVSPLSSSALFPPLASANVPAEPVQPTSSPLHSDIISFELEMLSIAQSKSAEVIFILSQLRAIASLHFPAAEVSLFGSYSTGLALPSSDMDVVIMDPGVESREDVQLAVRRLGRLLLDYEWTVGTDVIETASVPLVRLQALGDVGEGIKVDVSFECVRGSSTILHIGIASANYVRSQVLSHPLLRPLVLVLKHLLVLNDFNSAYTGGISSYALVLWALAYLKERETQDLGELLMGFLEYYGKEFDPKRVGIDLNGEKR